MTGRGDPFLQANPQARRLLPGDRRPRPAWPPSDVAIDAFHTDPASGDVDLDARLVPWIEKEDRGQAAFRAALDAALASEGFDSTRRVSRSPRHDLRKSLATDLAWNAELDELAKRRVMGHKAGDDVFARIYTLDHPTIAPLAAVAGAVEADITAKVSTLLVPTEAAGELGPGATRCAERAAHINAVLAEAGWQIEPGDPSNPWCDAARVMAELGIAATTARRWMRDQVIPSSVHTDKFGNRRRRARLPTSKPPATGSPPRSCCPTSPRTSVLATSWPGRHEPPWHQPARDPAPTN